MKTVQMSSIFPALLVILAFAGVGGSASAQITYGTAGSNYSQNFDGASGTISSTLAWSDNSTLAGWYALYGSTPATPSTFTVTNGTSAVGLQWFVSSANDTERSMGSRNGAGTTAYFGAQFQNTTGATLSQFTLSYDGEQWCQNTATSETLTFQYSLNAASLNDGGATWTTVSALQFASVQGATGFLTTINGNSGANRTAGINSTVSGLTWSNSSNLWIRWTDADAPAGNDYSMAIDNVVFSADAVPEPSLAMLIGVGLSVVVAVRRRMDKRS